MYFETHPQLFHQILKMTILLFYTCMKLKYGEGRYGDIYRDSTTVPIDQVINPQTHLPFEQGGRSEEYGE